MCKNNNRDSRFALARACLSYGETVLLLALLVRSLACCKQASLSCNVCYKNNKLELLPLTITQFFPLKRSILLRFCILPELHRLTWYLSYAFFCIFVIKEAKFLLGADYLHIDYSAMVLCQKMYIYIQWL